MITDATITPLIGSELACSICGIAVPRTEATERGIENLRSFGRERLPGTIVVRNDPSAREFDTKMTRCASCAESMHLAVQLTAQHPGPIQLGSFTYSGAKSVEVIVNALAVLAAAGERIEISEARELRQLTEILAQLGARLTWRSRFVPHADVDAHSSTAAARPFAHVSPELLEEAQASVLRLRVLRTE